MTKSTEPGQVAPNVGDKVVYDGDRDDWEWPDRRVHPGVVVEVDRDETVSVRVWAPAEGAWWGAPSSSVRVVERATYTPAGGGRRAGIVAAAAIPPGDPTTWMNDPAYRDNVRAFNMVNLQFGADLRAALAAQIPPGMWSRRLDDNSPFANLPALGWDDDPRGAYQVACGLSHYSALPATDWPTFLRTTYARSSEDGEAAEVRSRPLDLGRFADTSSRDVDLLAGIVVLSCQLHRRRGLR